MQKNIKIENRRYIGNKTKLRDWIISTIKKECGNHSSFTDLFAGTGTIAFGAKDHFEHLIINDILHSNFVCHQAFFAKGKFSLNKLEKIIENYNSIKSSDIKDNYFSNHFSGKYFSKNVARKIGYIRENIENTKKNLTKKEYYILLTSLIYSADKIANTVGHYDAYIKKTPKTDEFILVLIEPVSVNSVDIYQEDANKLADNLNTDVVYIDPPYNSRQYSRFYHLLETIVKWDSPELFGVALKPETENSSDYCKSKAPEVFNDLIQKLKCKHIVVSYNNTYESKSKSSENKITLQEIERILKTKGDTKTFKKDYRHFNAGNTNFNNHQEWLFVTKVYE